MTSDPKAPGAAAVYLDVEDISDDMLHSRIYYARIKVLKEEGKELASVEIPFQSREALDKDFAVMQLPYQATIGTLAQPTLVSGDKVVIADFKARVIHPDGTVVPIEGKLADLIKRETTPKHTLRSVVRLPGVEIGSVIEYRFVERYEGLYSSPLWQVQHSYFVRKAHYSFFPYKSFRTGIENSTGSYLIDKHGNALNFLLYYPHLPPHVGLTRDGAQHFLLDVSDVPAAPTEEWMPPIDNLLYSVRFYYRMDSNAKDFWAREARRWTKEVDHLAEPNKTIREAVAGITAHGDSEMEKAKKLYKAVQALDNTDFSRSTSTTDQSAVAQLTRRADETWTQKRGSSQEIALLYLAMVRAAGLTAYDLKVVNRDQGTFAQDYLYFDQLDDDIILVNIKGKEIALDPGEKMCPFEAVHWKHSGAGGLRETASGGAISTSPTQPWSANTVLRMGNITVDDQGAATGSFRFTMTGQEALHWRQEALLSDDAALRSGFDRQLASVAPPGMEAHIDRFEGITDPESSLVAIVQLKGSIASAAAMGFEVPCFPFEIRADHPFVDQAERSTPVDMRYAEQITDQVTYHLPAGVKVQNAPQQTSTPWEGHALLVITSKVEANQITLARSLTRAFAQSKPAEYASLHSFYEKVSAADRQQLELTRAAAEVHGDRLSDPGR